MADRRLILALDIGGSQLSAGVGEASGRLLAVERESTDREDRPNQIIEVLFTLSERAMTAAQAKARELSAVGISYGGPVDYQAGITVCCHHLPGWEGIPLRQMVQDRLGLPAAMDNDANAAALGEAKFGAGRGHPNLIYLTVSSGIGGGIILDGRVHRGVSSLAGEIGHVVLDPEGPLCTCGKRGCLEALASGWSIGKRAAEALSSYDGETSLRQLAESDQEITAEQVFRAAENGDEFALAVVERAAHYLGLGIAAAINLLNPSLVVIGGGVSKAGETLFRPVRQAVTEFAMEGIADAVQVVPAQLGDNVGILGAVALAMDIGED